MKTSEKLYGKLPVVLQNVACYLEGWRINRKRYNDDFHQILGEYNQRSTLSPSQIMAWRDNEIKKFVRYAAAAVPYYRFKFREWGINPAKINGLDDLADVPILTKEEVQQNLHLFVSPEIARKELTTIHTSGTTGGGLVFPATYRSQHHQWAVWWRYRQANGIEFGEWCGVFGGRLVVPQNQKSPPFWRYNIPARQVIFSGYHLRPDHIQTYLEKIKRSGIRWLHGYPSHLALVASFVIENKVKLEDQIRWITAGAESLLTHQKEIIEQGFGVQVRQHYGLAEGVANISECPQGRLHVDEDFSGVEFLPTADGNDAIIGTNFTNYAFPLIRYDTGDVARGLETESHCDCGRAGRIVKSIDGRIEDYVVLKDGTRIGRMDHIFKDMTHIREAQVYQRAAGKIQIRIVRAPEYSARVERQLLDETTRRIGKDSKIEIKYVDTLPRTPTGKLRFVISDVDDALDNK